MNSSYHAYVASSLPTELSLQLLVTWILIGSAHIVFLSFSSGFENVFCLPSSNLAGPSHFRCLLLLLLVLGLPPSSLVAQTGLNLCILHPPLQCWDDRCVYPLLRSSRWRISFVRASGHAPSHIASYQGLDEPAGLPGCKQCWLSSQLQGASSEAKSKQSKAMNKSLAWFCRHCSDFPPHPELIMIMCLPLGRNWGWSPWNILGPCSQRDCNIFVLREAATFSVLE